MERRGISIGFYGLPRMSMMTRDHRIATPRRIRRWRRALIASLLCYGFFVIWRVFPRFDSRLLGQWVAGNSPASATNWFFHERGAGERWNDDYRRTFRWWTCGNVLVKHEDRGSRSANISAALQYAVRTSLFLGPPAGMTEFDLIKLDRYAAQFISRPRSERQGSRETLVLRRPKS